MTRVGGDPPQKTVADTSVDPPRATRPSGSDHLFRTPNSDPRIDPDRVGPVVEAYFHLPPIWAVDGPADGVTPSFSTDFFHAQVFERKLSSGLAVRVNRDGLFLFDFTHYPPAAPVVLPGFIRPEGRGSYRYTVEHDEADRRSEATAVLRAQVLNAHQACLDTAIWLVKRSSGSGGFPVTSWSSYKSLSLETPPQYWDDLESLHTLAHKIANMGVDANGERRRRRIMDLTTIDKSFDLLDQLLLDHDLVALRLMEAAFIAGNRRREKRYGEAITLGWTICEQLIGIAWMRHLTRIKENDPTRMTKERRAKLTGRDFTASVTTEMLELNGLIGHELFRLLEIARSARNNWAHKMKEPKERDVWACFKAIEQLMTTVLNAPLKMAGGGRGGVPQWPVWFWRDFDPSFAKQAAPKTG